MVPPGGHVEDLVSPEVDSPRALDLVLFFPFCDARYFVPQV